MRDGTIVYVHGAGDRVDPEDRPNAGVRYHGELIRDRLRELGREYEVVVCEWGDAHGSSLKDMPSTMPDVDAARTADMAWTSLRGDPYAPLRDIGAESLARNMGPSNAASHIADGYLLLWMEQGLGPDPTISGYSADQTGLAVAEAASRVRGSDAYAAARGFDVFSVIAAAARSVASIAAELLVGSDAGADEHAEVASGIGVKLSLLEWTAIAVIVLDGVLGEDNVPALLGLVATDRLRRARREFMSTGILGVADILLYQRNGGDIRRFVADELHRARVEETGLQQAGTSKGRVVALGNSLGGIILADTLAESARSDCDVFVTMGSQPGALQVLGALGEAASHDPFQPWLNIYDPRDFMAFKAVGIWHGATRIEDVEIDLGRGFPHSHGKSYFEIGSVAIPMMIEHLDRLDPS